MGARGRGRMVMMVLSQIGFVKPAPNPGAESTKPLGVQESADEPGDSSDLIQTHSCLCTQLGVAGGSANLGWAPSCEGQLAVGWDNWAFFHEEQGCCPGRPAWGYVHGS